jgi:hypothetical protein
MVTVPLGGVVVNPTAVAEAFPAFIRLPLN